MSIKTRLLALAFIVLGGCGGGSGEVPEADKDIVPPLISLNGEAHITIEGGADYHEQGATATDGVDGDVYVEISGTVDTKKVGEYTITYSARDEANNKSSISRIVEVVDTTPPSIILNGESILYVEFENEYQELGVTASDNIDEDISVTIFGIVDTSKLGEYVLTYSAKDRQNNTAKSVKRIVHVIDTTPPNIVLNGEATLTIELEREYEEHGAVAKDNVDSDVNVIISGSVNTSKVGEYIVTYSASDKSNNIASITRTVQVVDLTPPNLVLNGESIIEIIVNRGEYKELGATATDNVTDEVIVTITGEVDVSKVGEYIITYTGIDEANNTSQVQRTVIVRKPKPFKTRWEITYDHGLDITLYANTDYDYNYTVDWGDGTVNENVMNTITHTYEEPGEYIISIHGKFPHFSRKPTNANPVAEHRLTSVVQWGETEWQSMLYSFAYTPNLTQITPSLPDLSQVDSLGYMFYKSSFNGDISQWDISNVKSVEKMFYDSSFAGDISKWDVSNVSNLEGLFENSLFNSDISQWDVGNVTNMRNIFSRTPFNGDISKWDVSNVTNMAGMFFETPFNGDISQWNVKNSTDMGYMFYKTPFNGDISEWNVSNVTNMIGMFSFSSFNGDISLWNVSNVTVMAEIFMSSQFNGDISLWDVSNVTDMSKMFRYSHFNGDINRWNVGKVTSMKWMFHESHFNGDISKWDVSNVQDMWLMLSNDTFSQENYDKLLKEWSQLNLRVGVRLDANQFFSLESYRSREVLIHTFNWTINDKGLR